MKTQILKIFVVILFSSQTAFAGSEVLIPSGIFNMGTDKGTDVERPIHSVWLDAFYLDRFAVSNKDYEKFSSEFKRSQASSCDDCPVTKITWEEANNYCQNQGKRLPTEAEWEKARRGPDAINNKEDVRYGLSLEAGAAPVQSSSANGYGLHHMAGNVWEWTNDWFGKNYYKDSPQKNPPGPTKGLRKVVRGGSWYNDIWYLQTGMRFRLAPDARLNSLGFRCAHSP